MQIKIDGELCKACGYCIYFCPKKALDLGAEINKKGYQYVKLIKPEDCVGCGTCAVICPDVVIELEEGGTENEQSIYERL